MTNDEGANIEGEPVSQPTVAADAEADLKTASAKVPHHGVGALRSRTATLRDRTTRFATAVATSGRRCGQATRASMLRTQRRRLRLKRSARQRQRTRVEVPVLLWSDRLPGLVRPRQVALVLPSRRPRRPSRRVGAYVVDVNVSRTVRGAVSFVVLGIVGITLGIVLTIGSLAAITWAYQAWIVPTLGS